MIIQLNYLLHLYLLLIDRKKSKYEIKTGIKHDNVNIATQQRNSTCKGIVKIHTLQITTIKQNILYTFTTPLPRHPVSAQLRYQTNRDSCNRPVQSGLTTIHPVLWSSIARTPAVLQRYRRNRKAREILKILTASLNGTETNMCQAHLVVPRAKRESKAERHERGRERENQPMFSRFSNERHEFSGILAADNKMHDLPFRLLERLATKAQQRQLREECARKRERETRITREEERYIYTLFRSR